MSTLPLDTDYTARDFDALKDRLQRGIKSVFPTWTDFSSANFGNILLECMCFVGDVLGVYENNHAREAFLSTCVRRVNAQRHTRKINYTMGGAEAAQVTLQFTLREAADGDVVFEAGKIVRTQSATDPARVQLLTDLNILAGNLTGTVTAENSQTYTEYFDSDETADQEFELDQTPFLSIVSISDSVGSYSQVDTFLESSSTDRHFIALASEENRGLIRFGDGRNGKIPSGEITVVYKVGGGAVNIEAGTLVVPEFTVIDSLGNGVLFDVTNPSESTGGDDQESVDEARISAPASLTVAQNSVDHEDFEINARRVTGIARALMLTSSRYAGITENYGQLRVVARGTQLSSGLYAPATPTSAQLDEIYSLITGQYPPTLTFRFDVLAADFNTIDITSRLWLQEGANASTVDAAIRSNLADFFAALNSDGTPTNTVDFGYYYKDELGVPDPLLAWSDIFNIVLNTTGVRRVDEDAQIPIDDVTMQIYEFPKLGDVTLINARTGLALV